MEFGEVLNKYREELKLSVNKLGELADVSPTYISRIQNNPSKKPSKKIAIKFLKALYLQTDDQRKQEKMFNDFITSYLFEQKSYKDLNSTENEEYEKFVIDFLEYLNKTTNEVAKQIREISGLIYANKIMLKKDGSFHLTNNEDVLIKNLKDKPIFDLEWYLSQKDFAILGPRNIVTNENYKDIDYNVISQEDKEIILNIIHSYLMTKYKDNYRKDLKDFFDNVVEELINITKGD
ncbi:helix-turn-helix domain-containing protein [Staphylococcus hominis]|uniref:helix-turn-helix domain-containing protein n=1 Tax=Staphylococcus hominis TaxID=1290 RepID=UPI001F5A94C2|nr:helix-turn-helix transcriptional regulator [Staphylococcus hominis]MCI2927466.1 helix-turn-helix domain-containing protein [Staphylococcus hominis]